MNLTHTFAGYVNSHNVARQLQRLSAVALVALALLNPATVSAQALDSDAGDAPDSTNQSNQKMETFPGSGIIANYPTVYKDPNGIPGPIHWYASQDAWLGDKVTAEADADLLPDNDGLTNIDPTTNEADRDGVDDGVYLESLFFRDCGMMEFRYKVTVGAPVLTMRYVNIWIDFNRDGDWDDTLTCKQGSQLVQVPEWAVQDQAIAGVLAPGAYNFSTTPFMAMKPPSSKAPMWLRITLSEAKAPIASGLGIADGRGDPNGYRFGETEDYLLIGK